MKSFSERIIEKNNEKEIKTIHFITPFDSGGSSAQLRKEFNTIAIGDYRNRLIALIPTTLGKFTAKSLFIFNF